MHTLEGSNFGSFHDLCPLESYDQGLQSLFHDFFHATCTLYWTLWVRSVEFNRYTPANRNKKKSISVRIQKG